MVKVMFFIPTRNKYVNYSFNMFSHLGVTQSLSTLRSIVPFGYLSTSILLTSHEIKIKNKLSKFRLPEKSASGNSDRRTARVEMASFREN